MFSRTHTDSAASLDSRICSCGVMSAPSRRLLAANLDAALRPHAHETGDRHLKPWKSRAALPLRQVIEDVAQLVDLAALDRARNLKKSCGLLREAAVIRFGWIARRRPPSASVTCVGRLRCRRAGFMLGVGARNPPTCGAIASCGCWSTPRSKSTHAATGVRGFTRICASGPSA